MWKRSYKCKFNLVYSTYKARWGGVVDGKPVLAGLEAFGGKVLVDLWTRIQNMPEPEVRRSS